MLDIIRIRWWKNYENLPNISVNRMRYCRKIINISLREQNPNLMEEEGKTTLNLSLSNESSLNYLIPLSNHPRDTIYL